MFVMSTAFNWNHTYFSHFVQVIKWFEHSVQDMVKRYVPAAHEFQNIHKTMQLCADFEELFISGLVGFFLVL